MRRFVLYLVRMFASRGVPMMRLVIGKRFGKGVRMLPVPHAANASDIMTKQIAANAAVR